MNLLPLLLAAALLDAPEVRLSVLDGAEHAGRLERLDASSAVVNIDGTAKEIPLKELLEIRFASSAARTPPDAGPIELSLADGSRIGCTQVTTGEGTATAASPMLGDFSLPLAQVASVRFGTADSKAIEDAWRGLQSREIKTDMLVVRKESVLDHLSGVVGNIEPQRVNFLLDSDQIPVNRERVFGVVFYRRDAKPAAAGQPACRLDFSGDGSVHAKSLAWDGRELRAVLMAGGEVVIPVDKIRLADFSYGKLQYLSQLEPRDVEYTPYFDITWKFRRDRNLDGGALRLGNRSYSRGLCIHSKTLLRYRIGSEYRRFQAVMGIDELVAPRGDVHVVISGDGRTLLEADVRGGDPPRPLDLDVSGVRDLEILVDFGGDLDIADHLTLADARVIK